jgi:hypothetical protein
MAKGTNFKIISVTNPETEETLNLYVRYNWESEIEIKEYYLSESPNDPVPDWIDEGMIEDAVWEAGDVFMVDAD